MDAMPMEIGGIATKFIIFLVVLAGGAYGLLVWIQRRGGLAAGGTGLKIIHRQSLDARHLTWIVEVRGRTLLLGGGNGQVAYLADLTEQSSTEDAA